MDVFLLDGARTPIGMFAGALRPLRAVEFATVVADRLLDRSGVPPTAVERIVAGRVMQDMTESNPARIVGRRVGVPDAAPSFTLNMQCCSGMTAFMQAAAAVGTGEADCALALGLESSTNSGHVLRELRWGTRLGDAALVDLLRECSYAGSKLWGNPMAMVDVAENHARVDGISRREMEEYAVLCHRRAVDAIRGGAYANEIVPITVPQPRGEPYRFEADEHPRADASLEALANLPPIRLGGSVTAGTSAGLNDGAAAALVCSERFVRQHGMQPLARVVPGGTAMVGCDPALMGYSAVEAVARALKGAGRTLDDMDVIECNEGFAVQIIADYRIGGWPLERLNLDGGSVALGHPVGMSGLRILVHLAHALRDRDKEQGIGAVPAGSGLGTAVVLERAA